MHYGHNIEAMSSPHPPHPPVQWWNSRGLALLVCRWGISGFTFKTILLELSLHLSGGWPMSGVVDTSGALRRMETTFSLIPPTKVDSGSQWRLLRQFVFVAWLLNFATSLESSNRARTGWTLACCHRVISTLMPVSLHCASNGGIIPNPGHELLMCSPHKDVGIEMMINAVPKL